MVVMLHSWEQHCERRMTQKLNNFFSMRNSQWLVMIINQIFKSFYIVNGRIVKYKLFRLYEDAIKNYEGDDPLENWYEYILWLEQSFPKSGHESHMAKTLQQCLAAFEKDPKYSQDRRYIRLWINYVSCALDKKFYRKFSSLWEKYMCTKYNFLPWKNITYTVEHWYLKSSMKFEISLSYRKLELSENQNF